jgi:hypothetical protein
MLTKLTGVCNEESCKYDLFNICCGLVSGDSDKCLTGSAKLKLDQHRTSDNRQSTRRVNKGHVCNVCNKVFTHQCHLVHHKLTHVGYGNAEHTHTSKYDQGRSQISNQHPEHSTSSGEQLAESRNVLCCDICGQTLSTSLR